MNPILSLHSRLPIPASLRHPRNCRQALVALETVARAFRARGDARAVFPDLYAIITRRVLRALEGHGPVTFQEPGWLDRLAGIFGRLYLDALDDHTAGQPLPASAWQAAHDAALGGQTVPVHDAFLGISAHINYDLALGIAENIRAHGTEDDPAAVARYKHDHDAVNVILEQSIPECLDMLIERYGCTTTWLVAGAAPTRELVVRGVLLMLQVWRERVWDDMLAMLTAGSEADEAVVRQRMDALSGQVARWVCASARAWHALLARLPVATVAPAAGQAADGTDMPRWWSVGTGRTHAWQPRHSIQHAPAPHPDYRPVLQAA
jgi:hypothetical protein